MRKFKTSGVNDTLIVNKKKPDEMSGFCVYWRMRRWYSTSSFSTSALYSSVSFFIRRSVMCISLISRLISVCGPAGKVARGSFVFGCIETTIMRPMTKRSKNTIPRPAGASEWTISYAFMEVSSKNVLNNSVLIISFI